MNMAIEGVMIPVAEQKECLKALLAIKPTGPWAEELWGPDGEHTLEAAFRSWGLHSYHVSGCFGDLLIDHFMGPCGLTPGEERPLFQAIAPFVRRSQGARVAKTDSVISVADEEYHWRYIFKDGKLKEQRARVVWENV